LRLTSKTRNFYSAKSRSKNLRKQPDGKTVASGTLKEVINILLIRALTLLLLLVTCLTPVGAMAVGKGELAPGFTLEDMHGQKVSLADFKGRVVLLKLATTWCPPCKVLTAEINKAGNFLKEREVAVLEVFVQDSPAMVEKFLGETSHPMTYHALLDDGQAYSAYNVYVIPRLLVIDAEQKVQFDSGSREVTSEKIIELIEALPPRKASKGGAQKH